MHHIIDVGVAAHGIVSGKRIIMQPGQALKSQTDGCSPLFKLRWLDKLAVRVRAFTNQTQNVFSRDDGKEK